MKILYFAWLREKVGVAEEEVSRPADVTDVQGFLEWMKQRGGVYGEALADPNVVRVAVNQTYVDAAHPLEDGDEIALFPPVTGG